MEGVGGASHFPLYSGLLIIRFPSPTPPVPGIQQKNEIIKIGKIKNGL